jgi:hypothetical protein
MKTMILTLGTGLLFTGALALISALFFECYPFYCERKDVALFIADAMILIWKVLLSTIILLIAAGLSLKLKDFIEKKFPDAPNDQNGGAR